MRRFSLSIATGALFVTGLALAQQRQQVDPNDDMGAAAQGERRPGGAQPPRAASAPQPSARQGAAAPAARAEATRAFLGLGVAPDAEAAKRGAPVFAQNCAACHGPDARGGIGPNLLYSSQLLDDDHGEKLVPFLKAGRPEKGMPPFAQLGDAALTDITEFLHLQVENYANRGTYQNVNNLLVGDAKAGAAYFAKTCTACHSATGDLKGVGARFRPLDLQRYMIFPERDGHPSRMIQATVVGRDGTVEGEVTKIDDFDIVLRDKAGVVHAWRQSDVKVTLKDPLEWHKNFAYRLKDKDMTDLVTYLSTVK
ncbi:c-type cytochrome [Sphingomonas sp.]|uniref:c-type cytochrome n=1 Tax=Sphingomonas sp. TaxID=28214 RepID=UPI000DB3F6A2|nr:c-type cytochrome [Sphingomonas sp.]PZU06868.1 MAG: class I cytochrome c [Sphingomonas sp.]